MKPELLPEEFREDLVATGMAVVVPIVEGLVPVPEVLFKRAVHLKRLLDQLYQHPKL